MALSSVWLCISANAVHCSHVHNNYLHFLFNFIVLVDEWKKQLSVQLIDYSLLDVKETIASGLNVATVWVLIFVMFKILWVLSGLIIHEVY